MLKKGSVKVKTWDGSKAFSENVTVEIPVEYSNRATLLLHTQIAAGEHKGKPFRFIHSASGSPFRLEYDKEQLDIDARALITALMDKIIELKAAKAKSKG